LICREQLDELRATLHKPALAARVKPYKAGRLVNHLSELAENIVSLPRVVRSPDPTDDFLLALSEAGRADYLVTGDISGCDQTGKNSRVSICNHRFAKRNKGLPGWKSSCTIRVY
jgi:predicted nucleic acid-binding protein